MRIKFGPFGLGRAETTYENDEKRWRSCLCCHVRTATIFLGIIHLAFHILALTGIAITLLHPPSVPQNGVLLDNELSQLPTPQSEIQEEPRALPVSDSLSTASYSSLGHEMVEVLLCDHYSTNCVGNHQARTQDLNIRIMVTFCTLAITLFMIYGAIKGKASHLMPFFCLQVFNFCVSSLSVIGFLSHIPDVRMMIAQNHYFPMREQLLAMDPQCLSLLLLACVLMVLVTKAYCINIVWNCYKYLAICSAVSAAVARESQTTSDCEGQALFDISALSHTTGGTDLPDYATAVSDPRFAEKPAYSAAPPPYSAVVHLPPEEPEMLTVMAGAVGTTAATSQDKQEVVVSSYPENKL